MCLIYFSEGLSYCLEHRCFVLGGKPLTEEEWHAEVKKRWDVREQPLSQTRSAIYQRKRRARLKGDGP